ncbi:MAG: hypothetical protein HY718_09290, partial [Planctomycetes bacterium]|nr:hypothetical protein [Planctomycetota bacterium]
MAAAAPKPAPVWEYPIHADGGIVYDPLRREAGRTGQLDKYRETGKRQETLQLGPYHLRFSVPAKADAYDVVPISYELSWDAKSEPLGQQKDGPAGSRSHTDKRRSHTAENQSHTTQDRSHTNTVPAFPLAVEATAFEDESRRRGRDLFDLALPGRIDLNIEYLGSVTAHLRPGGRHNLKPDYSDQPADYPPFDRRPLVRSGVVEAGDLVWFKIRYTNSGTTILDPEGLGGCLFFPQLLRKNAEGKYEVVGQHYNLYIRDLEYLYPGESRETWINFSTFKPETPEGMGLVPGEYLLRVRLAYRCYKTTDPFLNNWDGAMALIWDSPFVVEPQARDVPVAAASKPLTDGGEPSKITPFIHTFEEFMTAFDCHQAAPADGGNRIAGTLHLQVAPWTNQIVVKLIGTAPVALASVPVPIEVGGDSLRISPEARPAEYRIHDGRREPVIASQTMADMRANIQLGPFPERHIRERLREMLDCGINVVATTAMPWLYHDRRNPPSNYNGDAMKYFLDVARREGMLVEGWGTYPFDRGTIQD